MPLLDSYIKAKYSIYWEFPTSVERLAASTTESELGRIAWQQDNNSLWLLISETPTWLSVSPIKGIATLDFGAIGAIGNYASLAIVESSVHANSIIEASLRIEATADHSLDDLIYDPIIVAAGNINPGVGFTLYGLMPIGNAYGDYKVNYSIHG